MANGYDDNQDDLVPRAQIRQLEEKAKRAGDLEAELAQVKRDAAFARALGDIEHPARQYFEKGYDGELDPEAIKTAARTAGLLTPAQPQAQEPPPEQRNDPTPAEMAAHARMAAASDGGSGNQPIDLVEAFGPRGSKKPDEIIAMARAAGRRFVDDQQ